MGGYKLTYFVVKGIGEPIRMLLHAAGIDFEDKRVTYEDWPKLKETMPGQRLPILETPDGKILRESMAICRYIALKNGLYSTDPEVLYQIELILGILQEIPLAMAKVIQAKDETEKAKETKEFLESHGPRLFNQLQDILDKSTTGYLADTPKPTLADLLLSASLDFMIGKQDALLAKYPKLVQHKEKNIAYFPKLSEYMKNRPPTLF